MLLDRRSWSRVDRTWFLCFVWWSRLFQLTTSIFDYQRLQTVVLGWCGSDASTNRIWTWSCLRLATTGVASEQVSRDGYAAEFHPLGVHFHWQKCWIESVWSECLKHFHYFFRYQHLGMVKIHVNHGVLRFIIHCVSKKRPTFTTCYNFYIHSSIATSFGINIAEKVGNQKVLYFPTTPNGCFCTTWGNRKPANCIFSLKTIEWEHQTGPRKGA